MKKSRATHPDIDEEIRTTVVDFLRDWLPPAALAEYRRMMLSDPEGWAEHPHFQGGIIPEQVLRGNGITEQVLGVSDLEAVWPDLLRRAVLGSEGSG